MNVEIVENRERTIISRWSNVPVRLSNLEKCLTLSVLPNKKYVAHLKIRKDERIAVLEPCGTNPFCMGPGNGDDEDMTCNTCGIEYHIKCVLSRTSCGCSLVTECINEM